MPRKESPPDVEKLLNLGVKTIGKELHRLFDKADKSSLEMNESISLNNYVKTLNVLMKKEQDDSDDLTEFGTEDLVLRFNNLTNVDRE